MIFYYIYLIFECFVASFLAFFLAQYFIISNKKPFFIIEFFNMYNFLGSIVLLKMLNVEYYKLSNSLLFISLILFYTRSFMTAKDKFDSRFRSMILSFGYTRESYFYRFLMKRILIRGLEGFFFSIAAILMINKIPFWYNFSNNFDEFMYVVLFLFGAGLIKLSNYGKISRT